jgi:hypothetical protein
MGTGVGEAMIIGAVTGAGTSAVTGGDPLKGALLGAAGGGLGAGVGGTLGGQAAGAQSATASQVAGQLGQGAATGAGSQAALLAEQAAGFGAPGLEAISSAAQGAQGVSQAAMPTLTDVPKVGFKDIFSAQPGQVGETVGNYLVQNPMQVGTAAGVLGGIKSFEEEAPFTPPGYSGPLSRFRYDPDKYRPAMAGGGLADSAVAQRYMRGGHLGSYSDGGRLLKGPGDGMSDSIPATIGRKQPARLADSEFVVPADVVSHLGNGSTDAGAKRLYEMMDRVRKARTGRKSQGKEINPSKYMPA